MARERVVRLGLSAEETRVLLEEVPRAYQLQVNEVLLTALVEALGGWSGRRAQLIEWRSTGGWSSGRRWTCRGRWAG